MHDDDRLTRLARAFENRLPPPGEEDAELPDVLGRAAVERLERVAQVLGTRANGTWDATDQVTARLLLADLDAAVQAIRRRTTAAGATLTEATRLLKQMDAELKRAGRSGA